MEAGDEFGNSLAMGDAGGDGCTDLAVGTPGEDMGAERNADTELRRPCPTRVTAERLRATGPCPRCALRHRCDALLTNASGTVSPTPCPAPNGPAARCAGSPTASSPPVLSDLGSGCRTLTHEAPGNRALVRCAGSLSVLGVATDRVTRPVPATHEAPVPLREMLDLSTHQHKSLVGSLSCTWTETRLARSRQIDPSMSPGAVLRPACGGAVEAACPCARAHRLVVAGAGMGCTGWVPALVSGARLRNRRRR
ncbi:FG-GAP repeat protein [Streptomyces hirsutus]|uniref:FG-GAP repeat protein n=1 Tax=Streptomyces hirsutus TaxID=35620 RepID=UPI0036566ED4